MPRRDGKTTRRSISVKGTTFARLSTAVWANGDTVSGVLEQLIAAYLDKQESQERPTGAKGRP